MLQHLRANLWLLLFTLILCCVAYPVVLLATGQLLFHAHAQGSMIPGPQGKSLGSRLIAQPFTGDEYFHPRPSAVSYNASASGASNWGASNYLLRDRVARTLGPIVKYADGRHVAPDVEKWFRQQPGLVDRWATDHPEVARAWAAADPAQAKLIEEWKSAHPALVAREKAAGDKEPAPADLAPAYFKNFSREHPGEWPAGNGDPLWSVPAVFFERWLEAHADAPLQSVPADMVMASGSGLDPHITLKSAHYQLDRVAGAWAKKANRSLTEVRKAIENILEEKKEAPFGGWFGVPLVNVLEVNLTLKEQLGRARAD